MEKFIKTATQVAAQIEGWFLKYHNQEKAAFNGNEAFTIFSLLDPERQQTLTERMNLDKQEIPVLILISENNQFIINTTARFIRLMETATESLYYSDFNWHKGYQSIAVSYPSVLASVKTNGYLWK